MRKEILLRIIIDEDKVAMAKDFRGFDSEKMSDQLELLGIFENLKNQQQRKIEDKFKWNSKDGKRRNPEED